MTQTLGAALKPFFCDKQIVIALRWLALWEARTGAKPEWKPESIVSHLSRCLNDKRDGTPFFADPVRAEVLFEALPVPEDKRGPLRALVLQAGREPAIRLVIDITRWPDKGEAIDALFDQLRELVLDGLALTPAALVLTDRQFDRLPRSYDDLPVPLQPHRVRDAGEGVSKACELAGSSALILAPWQVKPIERWLAAHFDGRQLSLEPADGLAVFAEKDGLPGVPEVAHRLADITAPTTTRIPIETLTPVQRRRWIYALADEAMLAPLLASNKSLQLPAARLAFAEQLGAQATSREVERLAHELDELAAEVSATCGLAVEVLDAATHQQRLAKAQIRPVPPAAWRLADAIHVLGVTPARTHPRIHVHLPCPPQPAISRLLERIADWTADDHDSDPSMLHAIDAMAAADERNALLHARATLLWNDLLPAPQSAPPVGAWASGLRDLLSADPPAACLHLHTAPRPPGREYENCRVYFDHDPAGRIVAKAPNLWRSPPARPNLLLSRERPGYLTTALARTSTLGVTKTRDHYEERSYVVQSPNRYDHSWTSVPTLWVPAVTDGANLVNTWLDYHERSAWPMGWTWDSSERCQTLLRAFGERPVALVEVPKLEERAIRVDATTWAQADLLLAHCWLALRAAMVQPLAVRMHSGAVVLSLGGGVSACVELTTRRGAYHGESDGTVTAALDASLQLDKNEVAATIDFASLWTHDAKVNEYAAQLGVRVPARVIVRGPQIRADIRFCASPLLQPAPTTQLAPLTAIVASIAADEGDDEDADD